MRRREYGRCWLCGRQAISNWAGLVCKRHLAEAKALTVAVTALNRPAKPAGPKVVRVLR